MALLVTKSHFQKFLVSLYYLVQKKGGNVLISHLVPKPPPLIPRIFRLWRKGTCSLGADHLG